MARIAAQLYTLRSFTSTRDGFEEVLRRCREIGYEGVQLSAVGCMNGDNPEVGAELASEMLDRHGLLCCATHRPWDRLRDHTDAEIAFHQTLGCDYTAIGGIWGDYGELPEGFTKFLEAAKPVSERLAGGGVRFGYHNHSHEFLPDPQGGVGYDRLIAAPWLQLEVDTHWVAHAGVEPTPFLRRLAGRIAMVHLKDTEVVPGQGPFMCPVGEGNLNWDGILSALNDGGCEWWIVEQDDCRRDPFDCLASSFRFLDARLG